VLSEQALVTSPFGLGAVVTILIALAFRLDRKFRLFSFLARRSSSSPGSRTMKPGAAPERAWELDSGKRQQVSGKLSEA
jgi:hypothetical protein